MSLIARIATFLVLLPETGCASSVAPEHCTGTGSCMGGLGETGLHNDETSLLQVQHTVGQPAGPPGSRGPPGVGRNGAPGDTGPDGIKGPQGWGSGEAGPPGPPGPPGPAHGAKGLIGIPGKDIESVTANQGPKGKLGPKGPKGPRGWDSDFAWGMIQGARWATSGANTATVQATTGLNPQIQKPAQPTGGDGSSTHTAGQLRGPGPPGAVPTTGIATWPTGPPGPPGPPGETGPFYGAKGKRGPKGPNKGPAGQAGEAGPAGDPASSGDEGAPGENGPQGTAGRRWSFPDFMCCQYNTCCFKQNSNQEAMSCCCAKVTCCNIQTFPFCCCNRPDHTGGDDDDDDDRSDGGGQLDSEGEQKKTQLKVAAQKMKAKFKNRSGEQHTAKAAAKKARNAMTGMISRNSSSEKTCLSAAIYFLLSVTLIIV